MSSNNIENLILWKLFMFQKFKMLCLSFKDIRVFSSLWNIGDSPLSNLVNSEKLLFKVLKHNTYYTQHSRLKWFLREKIAATRQVVPNCYRTQIPNFQIEMLLLFKLGAGPQKMLTVSDTLKLLNVLKPAPRGVKMYSNKI